MDNILINNILSDDQIESIYGIINNTPDEQTRVQTRLGHKAYLVGLGEDVRSHIEKIIQDIYGDKWILNAYQFARYSRSYGYEPKLYPHFDDAFEEHKLTLDIQLKSSIDWPIVVEGTEYLLSDNQGVVFYGTDQIHWRTPISLSDSDQVDMIFCHFSMVDDPRNPITEEHRESMRQREKEWGEKINISREEVGTE